MAQKKLPPTAMRSSNNKNIIRGNCTTRRLVMYNQSDFTRVEASYERQRDIDCENGSFETDGDDNDE